MSLPVYEREQAWEFAIELCELPVSLRQSLPASLGRRRKQGCNGTMNLLGYEALWSFV